MTTCLLKKKKKERKTNVILLDIVQNFVNFDKLPAFVNPRKSTIKGSAELSRFRTRILCSQISATSRFPPTFDFHRRFWRLVRKQYTTPTIIRNKILLQLENFKYNGTDSKGIIASFKHRSQIINVNIYTYQKNVIKNYSTPSNNILFSNIANCIPTFVSRLNVTFNRQIEKKRLITRDTVWL